jgi:Beige/BEACH domain/PH domain associated with Beige/BEACH
VRLTLSILTVSTATCNTFNLNIMPLPSSMYTQVQLELMISGVLVLTNKTLYFHPNKIVGGLSTNKKPLTDHRWHIDRLLEAYGRRFLLQNCAIELFFADSPEVYVAFSTLAELQRFFRCLKRQNVPNLHASTSRSLDPRVVFANSPWTDLWRRRLISNFEYLMRLNILAGRSYNDITQYPVFPWIIADYTSEVLDLYDPASFRDLSKPVGALNPVRLAEIKERYDSFDSDIMPPFMYGSHYSSAGVVIHYMMRQEPFTTMFVNLQGGKFDCPDRVFFDIKSTWDCCNKDRSDVKELIVSTL